VIYTTTRNKYYFCIVLLIFCGLLAHPSIIFSAPRITPAKTTQINQKKFEELKDSFDRRIATDQDCTDLFQNLPPIISSNNADLAISFLLKISKKYNKNVLQIKADPEIRGYATIFL